MSLLEGINAPSNVSQLWSRVATSSPVDTIRSPSIPSSPGGLLGGGFGSLGSIIGGFSGSNTNFPSSQNVGTILAGDLLSSLFGLSTVGSNALSSLLGANSIESLSGSLQSLAQNAFGNMINRAFTIGNMPITLNPNSIASTDALADNALNGYIDVQYHITLSMVSETKMKEYQTVGFKSDLSDLDNDDENIRVLAATGNVKVSDQVRNYYNITSMDIEHLMSPTESNPMITSIPGLRLEIVEPVGLDFAKHMRDLSALMGYQNVTVGRVGYRVDIYFSGFDENSGEWFEKIPMMTGDNAPTSISYLLGISDVNASITPAGTTYAIDMVPSANAAVRPEDFILYAGSTFTGETFGEFLAFLKERLENEKIERTAQQVIRKYEFYAPSELLDQTLSLPELKLANYQFLFDPAESLNRSVANGVNVDIEMVLRGVIANIDYAQRLFISDSEYGSFLKPRIMWTIRFNAIYGEPDRNLKDYADITYQYFIEPYLTYQGPGTAKENIDNIVAEPAQLQRLREMIQYGMLKRIYNYHNTPDNTEVINMKVSANLFYRITMDTNNRSVMDSGFDDSSSANVSRELNSLIYDRFVLPNNAVSNAFDRLGITEGSTTGSSDDRFGGSVGEKRNDRFYGDISASAIELRSTYERHLEDYFKLDFLSIEDLQIRGDPMWFFMTGYTSATITNINSIDPATGNPDDASGRPISLQPRNDSIIYLRVVPSVQDDYMDPDRETISSSPSRIGGFYQITKVTSRFSNGTMRQTLQGTKIMSMNGLVADL